MLYSITMLGGVQNRQTSTAVANIMAAMAKALPSYAWLTALPQLISRICHTNPEVNTVTNHIITHVAEAYPQQVWQPPLHTLGSVAESRRMQLHLVLFQMLEWTLLHLMLVFCFFCCCCC